MSNNDEGVTMSLMSSRLIEICDALFDKIKAGEVKELPIVLKADVVGSGEALKDSLEKLSNEEVAVKVLKPNSREIIESDVKIMKFLAERMNKYISVTRTYNLPAMVSEFERSIFKEINFLEESMNLQNLSRNFKNVYYIKI